MKRVRPYSIWLQFRETHALQSSSSWKWVGQLSRGWGSGVTLGFHSPQGACVNDRDNFGWTPLHEACNWGHLSMCVSACGAHVCAVLHPTMHCPVCPQAWCVSYWTMVPRLVTVAVWGGTPLLPYTTPAPTCMWRWCGCCWRGGRTPASGVGG